MLAIALTIAVPVISRLLPVPVAAVGMDGMAGMGASGPVGGDIAHKWAPKGKSPPVPAAPTTKRCGYCDLLGHMPVLLGVASLPILLPLPPARSGVALPAPRQAARWVLAAAPRGPPGGLPA